MTAWTCSKKLTSVSVPAQDVVSSVKNKVLSLGISLNINKVNSVHESLFLLTHLMVLSDPASQWYLAGTDFHCLAKATMAPASRTPKPNRWLNSRPTPFMVQWNRPFESYNEFRFEVKTVRCCMSRQVSWRLKLYGDVFSTISFETNEQILNCRVILINRW